MKSKKSTRLSTLLSHLAADEYRVAPLGVGLKTALEGRELGLIEINLDGRKPLYRLTEVGLAYRG